MAKRKTYIPEGHSRRPRTIRDDLDEKIEDYKYWKRVKWDYEAFSEILETFFREHPVKPRPKKKA